MTLNYTAILIISLLPFLLAMLWYHSSFPLAKWSGIVLTKNRKINPFQILWLYVLSVFLIFGFSNLVIHQIGFYELFFTDIMKGSQEAQQITTEFLSKYGQKHRHFGHGFFHGIINAFSIALPFIAWFTFIEDKDRKHTIHHFSYWLVTTALTCGLISEFV